MGILQTDRPRSVGCINLLLYWMNDSAGVRNNFDIHNYVDLSRARRYNADKPGHTCWLPGSLNHVISNGHDINHEFREGGRFWIYATFKCRVIFKIKIFAFLKHDPTYEELKLLLVVTSECKHKITTCAQHQRSNKSATRINLHQITCTQHNPWQKNLRMTDIKSSLGLVWTILCGS